MLYKLNVPLIIKGDRIRKGTEVELSAEESANLDPQDITLVSSIKAPEPEVELASISLEEMTYAQLQARAKELELSAAGSAADIRERITLHLTGPDPEEAPELVDHVLTEEDRTEHPEYFERPEGEPEAQLGDIIKVPAPITND